MKLLLWVLLFGLIAGCSRAQCEREQLHHRAQEFPPLQAPPGLEVPPPDPNFAIPRVDSDGPLYAEEVPDPDDPGETKLRCLDMPPRMNPG